MITSTSTEVMAKFALITAKIEEYFAEFIKKAKSLSDNHNSDYEQRLTRAKDALVQTSDPYVALEIVIPHDGMTEDEFRITVLNYIVQLARWH